MKEERLLRSYERMAQTTHWCDRCCRYIEPGDMYEGEVYVNETRREHRLVVFKFHIFPSCDYPEEPKDEGWEDEESENLESRVENAAAEVKRAA